MQAGFDSMWGRYPKGHELAGAYVTREIECDCGVVFEQRKVSRQFVERALAPFGNALRLFLSITPGGWLPVYCHKCERLSLAGKARPIKPKVKQHEQGA